MLQYFLSNRDSMDVWGILYMMLAYAVILFLTLPVHELAHGLMAHWCGDDTAKWHGRLSLNPLRHLDLWGTLMILTVGIGYAKPVPVNPRNFRKYKRDMILVALAGPLSNFLMALVATILRRVCFMFGWGIVILILDIIISVNISLMVFNLLPIPPLDGSRLWSSLLPGRWAYTLEQYSRYITMGLFVLLFSGVLDRPLYVLQAYAAFFLDVIAGVLFLPINWIIGLF